MKGAFIHAMAWLLIAVPAAALLIWLLPFLEAVVSGWTLRLLGEFPPDGPGPLPRLSVIVPALDEESTIEPAMTSLLAVDYPDLEVIAVDDRSTDRTGAILDRLAAENPRLKVIHITDLPPGWLGKNHAMHRAAEVATGGFLLFTDADVHFEATSLRRAVRYSMGRQVDHLSVLPSTPAGTFWESVAVGMFGVLYGLFTRPWKVADPKSRAFAGVGAFNLVRTDAYRRAGGHASLPMEIADDVKLGKRLKMTGGRADIMFGGPLVRVRWVIGLPGIIHGLTKNMFAGCEYRLHVVLMSSVAVLLMSLGPVIGLITGPPAARIIGGATMALMTFWSWRGTRESGIPRWIGLTHPLGGPICVYILLRSTVLTYWRGGVVWRGTLYPLRDLRKNVV